MRKVSKLMALAAFAVGSIGIAAPAQASTCQVAIEELDYVVCDVVYDQGVGTVCRVITRYSDCVQ